MNSPSIFPMLLGFVSGFSIFHTFLPEAIYTNKAPKEEHKNSDNAILRTVTTLIDTAQNLSGPSQMGRTLQEDITSLRENYMWTCTAATFLFIASGGFYFLLGGAAYVFFSHPDGQKNYVALKQWAKKKIKQ
ncbi:unnamed protein product [Phytomonas sp. Hart1]|nr:unnamed protein product [Phytomonas sp. Hart1]|eukprot:CCW71291.1 unnamed protein product [Phytomonas sp. isolate Hart1]